MTCVFWLGWFFMVLMCSIPMLTVSYFSFDFALKAPLHDSPVVWLQKLDQP